MNILFLQKNRCISFSFFCKKLITPTKADESVALCAKQKEKNRFPFSLLFFIFIGKSTGYYICSGIYFSRSSSSTWENGMCTLCSFPCKNNNSSKEAIILVMLIFCLFIQMYCWGAFPSHGICLFFSSSIYLGT